MSAITTHVLDTARGHPAAGVAVTLYRWCDQRWEELAAGVSGDDGRITNLLSDAAPPGAGSYRMHFSTGNYFAGRGDPVFYPYVDIVFDLDAAGGHVHIPLLLAPYGYTTYRGS